MRHLHKQRTPPLPGPQILLHLRMPNGEVIICPPMSPKVVEIITQFADALGVDFETACQVVLDEWFEDKRR